MCSLATKNPVKAVQYGVRTLRYLKGTKDYGFKYLTKEDTITKHEEFSSDSHRPRDASYSTETSARASGFLGKFFVRSKVF